MPTPQQTMIYPPFQGQIPMGMPGPIGYYQNRLENNMSPGGAFDYAQGRQGALGALDPTYQANLKRSMKYRELDVASNPYVQGAIKSATDPMVEAFQRTTDPAMGSGFNQLGQYGSSRHQMMRNQAVSDLTRNVGQTAG